MSGAKCGAVFPSQGPGFRLLDPGYDPTFRGKDAPPKRGFKAMHGDGG